VRLYRGEQCETGKGSEELVRKHFPTRMYKDTLGLCKIVSINDIAEQGYSLNPGRYVGVAKEDDEDFDYKERIEELNEELELLNTQASNLEKQIANNISELLDD
jgi:type I restriction enzyme M protein